MYSQSKGRQFTKGYHSDLLDYLVDTCPLHPDKDWQEDKKLNLILSKVQEHQLSLRQEPPLSSSSNGKSDHHKNHYRYLEQIIFLLDEPDSWSSRGPRHLYHIYEHIDDLGRVFHSKRTFFFITPQFLVGRWGNWSLHGERQIGELLWHRNNGFRDSWMLIWLW